MRMRAKVSIKMGARVSMSEIHGLGGILDSNGSCRTQLTPLIDFLSFIRLSLTPGLVCTIYILGSSALLAVPQCSCYLDHTSYSRHQFYNSLSYCSFVFFSLLLEK